MHLEKYSVVTDNDHTTYEFLSEGPKGTIKKVALYQELEENVFNLAFGDWDEKEQKINDKVRSNNRDSDKVLATVASTAIDFIKYHPDAVLLVQGSTSARTRLYQRGILKNLDEIEQLFDIIGFTSGTWQPFTKGQNYEAFTLKAK
jgi:hypothetical protein